LIIIPVLSFSCVGQSSSGGKRKSSSGATTTDDSNKTPDAPTFNGSANFLQNGSESTSTTLNLPGDFNTSLYLRGGQVDQFIKLSNKNTVQCLAVPYTANSVNKVLVLAAYPRFFFNFSTNTQEYYFLLEPAGSSNNATFCQQPGVITTLGGSYPGTSLAFGLDSVCPNCSLSTLVSDPLDIITQGGSSIDLIELVNLRFEIRTQGTVDLPSNLTCNSSAECIGKGFDCCSNGQCVKDKQVKSNVDQTSDEFLQALIDIQQNPNALLSYPEFFHICGTNIPVDPSPTPLPDPAVEAAERLRRLEELYNCTTPQEGEMSICTVEYEDVQSTITNTGSNQFETLADDRNFNENYSGTSTLSRHSLFKVVYAGEILFENGSIIQGMTIGPGGNGTGNDNLDDTQVINVTQGPKSSAPNDTLKIQYRVDGSCKKVNNFLAKCYKIYVQGENLGKITDHFPASNNFLLPYYADTNKTISVDVDEASKLQFSDWNLIQTSPARIEFAGSNLAVFDTQEVKITFFVSLLNYPNVLQKKGEAKAEIQTMCDCGTLDCSLKPVLDDSQNILNYECSYPQPDLPPPPLQQTVLISAKTVPHRFFNKDGVYQDDLQTAEGEQEGNEFKYTNNDLLRPNNVDTYVGFNEIYGTFNKQSNSAVPAREVRVVSGKTYDVFVNSGSFSTCFFCGTDYYSSLVRMFPQNFLSNGGGYTPDLEVNDPQATKIYRKDDLLFGRACFIPATMIPWTHIANSSRQDQRTKRLAAQHFSFANGYNRDWYGFDYGSVIGSFDGVLWFSIGNQRRIQARSSKLFLAINSYFGDLTDNTTFSITVQDSSTVSGTGAVVDNDFDSDGAECQKAHVCETDSDCASQLGWDYVCESVASITTNWPRFDVNALEVPGVADLLNLRSLVKATSGSSRRCVYRGRGAACIQDYTTADTASTYTGTPQPGLHACANNHFCQPFIEGVAINSFNNKVSRYGKSAKVQNASEFVDEDDHDVVGLGTRVLGRPYAWNGTDSIPTDAQSNFSTNNVTAMCIPGRDNNDDTFNSNHSNKPTSDSLGDQISGIGVTPDLTLGIAGSQADYLSRCSIFDTNGNYLSKQSVFAGTLLSDSSVTNLAARQALSTNSLALFESPVLTGNDFVKKFEEEFIEEVNYQESRCLRAPGSTCFSALDCAPNPFISDQLSSLNVDDPNVTDLLNRYEVKFWQEELICSQDKTPADEDFELGNNRCCRETGLNITVGTSLTDGDGDSGKDIDYDQIPGLSASINSQTRNSRLSTIWDRLQESSVTYPPLRSVRADSCSTSCGDPTALLDRQFNTLEQMASRTCCSGHWIRNFDREENGGGHAWGPAKLQQIPKETFRCYNYAQCLAGDCGQDPGASYIGFTCEHTTEPDDPNCRAKNVTLTEATPILEWMGKLELTGVPQIYIPDSSHSNITCTVDPEDQGSLAAAGTLPAEIITTGAIPEYLDGALNYLSANDMSNFDDDNIKKIFSSDDLNCCLPAGTNVGTDADPNICCTGYISPDNGLCQLPAYTDISVYLNKYVSSEAKDEVPGAFNADTGYLVSPFDTIRLACAKKLCESNSLVEGIVLSNLKTRGHETNNKQKQRFIDGSDEANNFSGLADLFDRGLKWNDHIYCADPELENPLPGTIDCGSF